MSRYKDEVKRTLSILDARMDGVESRVANTITSLQLTDQNLKTLRDLVDALRTYLHTVERQQLDGHGMCVMDNVNAIADYLGIELKFVGEHIEAVKAKGK